ncbi:MAG: hypothetical protein FD181_3490 [Prolixibacteraceae bacterium]|nr:MAG: hypothetical protein FD181_3490 [Prolixibacteraceae bacterium]
MAVFIFRNFNQCNLLKIKANEFEFATAEFDSLF